LVDKRLRRRLIQTFLEYDWISHNRGLTMDFFLQVTISGLATGAVYGLIALGVVVVFSTTRLLNFAQGQFAMIGGLVGWYCLVDWNLPYVVAIAAVIAAGGLSGLLMSTVIVNPMLEKGADLISVVIATLGLSITLSQAALLIFGPETRSVPAAFSGEPIRISRAVVTQPVLGVVVGAVVCLAIFAFVRSRTHFGLTLRAVGANRVGSRVVGLNPKRIAMWGFILSGAITCLAGLLVAPTTGWTPRMGIDITVSAFIGAIVGGIANVYSAFMGGLLVGVLNQVMQAYLPSVSSALVFVALIAVIALRPRGLIPSSETATGPLRS
jgi:branched-chain amino acid transport system permease protein